MVHIFARKLAHGAKLTAADEQVLAHMVQSVRTLPPHTDIWAEGDEPRTLPFLVDGWAYRYRLLENGRRQILTFLVPGDLCEPFGVLPQFADFSLSSLTTVVMAPISLRAIAAAASNSPAIQRALWWDLLVVTNIEREHMVSLGRRSAVERLAHLFCELHLRLSMVDLVDGPEFDMPATQLELGDLLGLSTVHVNRSLQELRHLGLISLRERRLKIHDLKQMQELALFNPSYLHSHDVITH